MMPPRLVAESTTPAGAAGLSWFRVEEAGVYDGRWWRAGERIGCVPRSHTGDAVVLVPVGRGEPRLGRVRRLHLEGDRQEACDPARWRVAGRVAEVRAAPAPTPVEPQLSLFAMPSFG